MSYDEHMPTQRRGEGMPRTHFIVTAEMYCPVDLRRAAGSAGWARTKERRARQMGVLAGSNRAAGATIVQTPVSGR